MKKLIYLSMLPLLFNVAIAQNKRPKQMSFAVSNVMPAMPFGKFAGFFNQNFHPGIEAGYTVTWKKIKKHEWFQDIQAEYFYHRFVQHGFSLYTDFGYRYNFNRFLSSDISLGAGCMLSVPATASLVLNDKGDYDFNPHAARLQTIAPFNIGLAYVVKPSAKKPVKIFSRYQQKIQCAFIKEYVPLLPYTSLSLGIAVSL
jgi:hypothetical protein